MQQRQVLAAYRITFEPINMGGANQYERGPKPGWTNSRTVLRTALDFAPLAADKKTRRLSSREFLIFILILEVGIFYF